MCVCLDINTGTAQPFPSHTVQASRGGLGLSDRSSSSSSVGEEREDGEKIRGRQEDEKREVMWGQRGM